MRLANDQDTKAIIEALSRLKNRAYRYGFVGTVDFDKALSTVLHSILAGDGYVIDGYLVMVRSLSPWYSTDKILQEWLVLKLYVPFRGLNSVPQGLVEIAQQRGCRMLITGDSAPVDITATAYKQAGFSNLTQSFYKEI